MTRPRREGGGKGQQKGAPGVDWCCVSVVIVCWWVRMGGNASVGLTTEQTDIYILIGKSWTKKVKKYFFGNFFWTVPF